MCVFDIEYVPSLHLAVAPAGASAGRVVVTAFDDDSVADFGAGAGFDAGVAAGVGAAGVTALGAAAGVGDEAAANQVFTPP